MVEKFHASKVGKVPQIKTSLSFNDRIGIIGIRCGLRRSSYNIPPGLYCVGTPDQNAPVLVTCNYKLTFNSIRTKLKNQNIWILVIDTRGINVWCAAGKKTFSTEEIIYQVNKSNLKDVVCHRELILPQLGAVGIAAHKLKKQCGFKGVFGPIRAEDIPTFLTTGKATEKMRSVTFTLMERLVLTPVEMILIWRKLGLVLLTIFLISGIGPEGYSISQTWVNGSYGSFFTILAVLAGTLATPLLLPWIPFKQFWLKGALSGFVFSIAGLITFPAYSILQESALVLWSTALSSYLAMNFTGSTPYTSLTGVKKEMNRGVPFQLIATLLSVLLWVAKPFI